MNLDLAKKPSAWLMTPLFLIRRFVFAVSITYFGSANSPLLQIYVQVGSSLLMFFYISTVLPYTDTLLNVVDIVNELTLLALSYFMFLFTDFVPDPAFRFTLGWVFSGIIAFNLLFNWLVLFSRMLSPLFSAISAKL